jgi:hypothetical protein
MTSDKRFHKYLSRYSEFRFMGVQYRGDIRVIGRSLQALHEEAVSYVMSSLPESEKVDAVALLRRKYNSLVRVSKSFKRDMRVARSFFEKYKGKRLIIKRWFGNPLVCEFAYVKGTNIHVIRDGRKPGEPTFRDYYRPNIKDSIEVIGE